MQHTLVSRSSPFATKLRDCGMTRYFPHRQGQNEGKKRTNLHCFVHAAGFRPIPSKFRSP
jgi:hypothetical protein